MNIAITTDILDTTKYPKGVYFYIKNLVEQLNNTNDNNNYYTIKNPSDIKKHTNIVHITEFRMKWLSIILNKNIKTILTCHGGRLWIPPQSRPSLHKKPKAWIMTKIIKWSFPFWHVDKYISVSNFLKDRLIEDLNINKDRIEVVYLAPTIRDNAINHHNKEKVILSDTPIPDLINILYELRMRGFDYNLLVFSKREYGYQAAIQRVNELDIVDNVKFLGHISKEQLTKLYKESFIFVHLPLVETFGIPPLEAMACGCPVVCSDVGSITEIVDNCGIIKDKDDLVGLANVIEELLKNEEVYEYFVQRGLERSSQFTWDKMVRETIRIYDSF